MLTLVSVISGMVFVLLAGLNPWIMLTNRANSKPSGRTWMRVHRTVGYVFIAVFMVTAYFMLLRLKGESDELAPRILLHMLLALTLAPLLLMKVLVARYQPQGSSVLLPALGITIFLLSFTVVAVNVVPLALRDAKGPGISTITSLAFVLVVLASVAILLLKRRAADLSPAEKTIEPSRRRRSKARLVFERDSSPGDSS